MSWKLDFSDTLYNPSIGCIVIFRLKENIFIDHRTLVNRTLSCGR